MVLQPVQEVLAVEDKMVGQEQRVILLQFQALLFKDMLEVLALIPPLISALAAAVVLAAQAQTEQQRLVGRVGLEPHLLSQVHL